MDGFKPCPACGENALVRRYEDGCCFIVCLSCNMRGPGESNMIAAKYAWNSLPRRNEITPNSVDCQGCPERRYRSHAHD